MNKTKVPALLQYAAEYFSEEPLNESEQHFLSVLPAGGSVLNTEVPAFSGTVRAELLRWLCLDANSNTFIGHSGIDVTGVRFTGKLDLQSTVINFPLVFTKCIFEDDINLRFAETRSLLFSGSRIRSFQGERLTVKGMLYFNEGLDARGLINLAGARIDGNLDLSNGYFINKKGKVIQCNRIEVGGSVLFDQGFKAEGEVQIIDGMIRGNLSCRRGMFLNNGKDTLSADRIKVGGSVFINGGFTSDGFVRLPGAEINGQLNFENSVFIGTHRNGVFAQNLTVNEGLFWRGVTCTNLTELTLAHARAGQLCDDAPSWPAQGNLIIDGFLYREIASSSPTDVDSRSDWLRRQPLQPFRPQPYEQLAAVLKSSGFEEEARSILIDKQRNRLRYGNVNRRSYYWNKLLGLTIGYGYRPHRSLLFMAVFLFIGTILFEIGFKNDAIAPTNVVVISREEYILHRRIPEAYPSFNALVYSLDAFLPIVDLHQSSHWLPNKNRGAFGIFLFWYMRFHIMLGWILTSLAVIGFSGIVRKD
jgi:hypothetical protein